MKTTTKYDHDQENILDALGVDLQKVFLITMALEQFINNAVNSGEGEHLSKSKIYEKIIELCSTPEELALVIAKFTLEKIRHDAQDMRAVIPFLSLLKELRDSE